LECSTFTDASRDAVLSCGALDGIIAGHPARAAARREQSAFFPKYPKPLSKPAFGPVAVAIHAAPDRRSAGHLVRRICHAIDEHDEER